MQVIGINSGKVHGIVQHPVHNLLVPACVIGIALEDLADAVHARGIVVVAPEVLLYVSSGVDAKAVDFVLDVRTPS